MTLCRILHSDREGWVNLVGIVENRMKSRVIGFVSIFTALYAVLRLIPTVPMIGGSGATFSLSDVIAPIYGVILGPYIGGLSVILGTFLSIAMGKSVSFMFLDFLPATVGALSLGLLIKGRWKTVVVLNLTLLGGFLFHPLTDVFIEIPVWGTTFSVPFVWLHIVGLAVLLSPLRGRAVEWVKTVETTKIVVGVALLFLVGTMIQHLMGSLLFSVIYGQLLKVGGFPEIWSGIFFIYPVERLALVALGVVVGAPLLRGIRNYILPVEG